MGRVELQSQLYFHPPVNSGACVRLTQECLNFCRRRRPGRPRRRRRQQLPRGQSVSGQKEFEGCGGALDIAQPPLMQEKGQRRKGKRKIFYEERGKGKRKKRELEEEEESDIVCAQTADFGAKFSAPVADILRKRRPRKTRNHGFPGDLQRT